MSDTTGTADTADTTGMGTTVGSTEDRLGHDFLMFVCPSCPQAMQRRIGFETGSDWIAGSISVTASESVIC